MLTGSTVFAQVLGILISPVITRLYSPADFGVLALYLSLLGILGVVSSLKYELAIPLAKNGVAAANVLAVSLLTAVVFSSLVGIGAGVWARSHNSELLTPEVVWLLPLGMILVACYRSFSYWSIRSGSYSSLARTKLSQAVGAAAAQLGFGFAGTGPIGLIFGNIVGQSSGVLSLARQVWRRDRFAITGISYRRMVLVARRFSRFPTMASGSSLLNTSGLYIVPLLLARFYGTSIAGWYALAERVVSVPINVIGNSIAQVYFGDAAKLTHEPARLCRAFTELTGRLMIIGIIPAIVVALVAEPAFGVVFGEEWRTAGTYAQALAVWLYFKFVAHPVSQTLDIIQRQDLSLMWSSARLAAIFASIAVPALLNWPAEKAILAFASTGSLLYGVLLAITLRAIRRIDSSA